MTAGAGVGGAGLIPAGLGGAAASDPPFDPGDGTPTVQGPELARQTSHVAQAFGLLIEQFKKEPKIQALVRSWLLETQAAEDAGFELLEERSLDTSVGEQLDGIGELVDEPRLGRDDDTYRVQLRARIAINRSNGLTEELLQILRLLLPAGTAIRIDEQPPAAFVVEIEDPIDTVLGDQVARLLRAAKAAGVRYLFHWRRAAPRFRYSPTGSPVLASPNGYGAGEYSAISDGTSAQTFVP